MTQERPTQASQIGEAAAKAMSWLANRVEELASGLGGPAPVPATDMTDQQLLEAVHDVGGRLLNGPAPMIGETFARLPWSSEQSDPRFPHAMPVKVRGHVLSMTTEANDAFWLSLYGLNKYATAAALGAIRNVAETLAWTAWLLEDTDADVRQARSYRLTLNAIDSYRSMWKTLEKTAGASGQAEHLARIDKRMRDSLISMASQDGINIPDNPGSVSRLMERHLPVHGGYLLYALLNRAGAHPGPARASQIYANPVARVIDYDFKGLHIVRAYWITQSIRLHTELCRLAAPVLGWNDRWGNLYERTQQELLLLASEIERRYREPLEQALAQVPDTSGTNDG
jgi:hypothetical protein